MLYYTILTQEFYNKYDNAYSAEHSAVYGLLKCAIKREYNIERLLEIERNTHGKPYFADSGIHFNLSHCKGIAVCGISDSSIGIDCEVLGRISIKAAKRIFSDNEFSTLESLDDKDKELYFSQIWTAKEAYGKACGNGLSTEMSRLDFGNQISEYNGFYFSKQLIGCDDVYILTAVCQNINDISQKAVELHIM